MVEYKDRLATAMGESISAKQLADALKVSYQAVKKVIEGKSAAFTAENNSKAAKFLQISSDWLATGEGEMRPGPDKSSWPFSLFPQEDYYKLDKKYREEIENTLAGAIQRIKQTNKAA